MNLENNKIYVSEKHWYNSIYFDDCIMISNQDIFLKIFIIIYNYFCSNINKYKNTLSAEYILYDHINQLGIYENIIRIKELDFCLTKMIEIQCPDEYKII